MVIVMAYLTTSYVPTSGKCRICQCGGGFLWSHVLSGRGISGTMSLLGVMVSAQEVCMFKGVGTHPPGYMDLGY